MPDIETFFRFSPSLNSITSQTFKSDMAGTHELNFTIADLYDARRFASLEITVDPTYNDTRVTEPTALGDIQATLSDYNNAIFNALHQQGEEGEGEDEGHGEKNHEEGGHHGFTFDNFFSENLDCETINGSCVTDIK